MAEVRLLANLDVPAIAPAEALYAAAFGFRAGRRFGDGALELLGAGVPLYLLAKPAGSEGAGGRPRDYRRHWTPCHLDVAVDDLDAARARAEAAGMRREGDVRAAAWGRIAELADPFGHGWCLLEFSAAGYDAIADPAAAERARRPAAGSA